MILYHASKEIVQFPEIRKARYTKDFSWGFYCTNNLSDDWLDFIAKCRNGKTHSFDIVEGPMANDTIWNYVNDYLSGRITRKQFWVLAEFKYPTHQISFHTLSALDCLTFERSEIIYDPKRTK